MEEAVERRQSSFFTQYKDHKNTNNRKKKKYLKVLKEAERVAVEIFRLSTQKSINHLTLNV